MGVEQRVSPREGTAVGAVTRTGVLAPEPVAAKQERSPVYLLAVLASVLFWSTSFVMTKAVLTEIPPFTIGAVRTWIAAGILGLVVAASRTREKPSRSDLGIMALGGFLGITVYFALENVGLQLATASDAALIVASFPAITLLLEMIVDRCGFSPAHLLGIVLSIAGVGLIVYETSTMPAPGRLTGDLVLAGTGLVWAAYNFATRRVQRQYSTQTVVFYQSAAGAITFVPLALIEHAEWRVPSAETLVSMAYLSVFCSVLAFLFYAYGLRGMRSSTAVTMLNLIPVLGIATAFVFLHETETMVQLIGGAIVIAGVALSVRDVSQSAGERY